MTLFLNLSVSDKLIKWPIMYLWRYLTQITSTGIISSHLSTAFPNSLHIPSNNAVISCSFNSDTVLWAIYLLLDNGLQKCTKLGDVFLALSFSLALPKDLSQLTTLSCFSPATTFGAPTSCYAGSSMSICSVTMMFESCYWKKTTNLQ